MTRLAALLLLATPLAAAPVPRDVPEPPLTAERLVGAWEYRYGGLAAGEIVFYANGDYLSHHGGQYGYAGRWRLDGDTVELLESPLDECGVPRCQWARYEFRLEVCPGGVLAGESVRLSNRRLP